MVAHKDAGFGSARVTADLEENHGRKIARSFVQNAADAAAAVAPAREADRGYGLPGFEEPVATVTVGLDGTCMLMGKETRREAIIGTLGSCNKDGQRLHTAYAAATPGYGKLTFTERFDREVGRARRACPEARYVGPAGGAKDNRAYPDLITEVQAVDFYHVTTYLWAAEALSARDGAGLRPWADDWCGRLRHEDDAAAALIADLGSRGAAPGRERPAGAVARALTYLRNLARGGRLNYAGLSAQRIPFGSGVTEAACKALVKQRLCGSGMKWKEAGAAAVLGVRCLTDTTGRWSQMWSKVDRHGYPVAA